MARIVIQTLVTPSPTYVARLSLLLGIAAATRHTVLNNHCVVPLLPRGEMHALPYFYHPRPNPGYKFQPSL